MIEVKNLTKKYNAGKKNEIIALNDVSFTVNDGETVAVVGKSGAGKSTLLHILSCTENADSGQVFIDGKDILRFTDKQASRARSTLVGLVLQDFALVSDYTVRENIELPLLFAKKRISLTERIKRVTKAAQQVGIEEYLDTYSNRLSGGQRQRVAIARALAADPKYILADEPTGQLDSETAKQITGIFEELNNLGKTLIIVTHDNDTAAVCKRKIILSDGKIVN